MFSSSSISRSCSSESFEIGVAGIDFQTLESYARTQLVWSIPRTANKEVVEAAGIEPGSKSPKSPENKGGDP